MIKLAMFLQVWESIGHMVLLALLVHFFLLWTDEYFLHPVLDWKVIGPQANITLFYIMTFMSALQFQLRPFLKHNLKPNVQDSFLLFIRHGPPVA